MKKILFIFLIPIMLGCEDESNEGNSYTISGTIKNGLTPVENADVALDNFIQYATTTDEDGYFEIRGVVPRDYILEASKGDISGQFSRVRRNINVVNGDVNIGDLQLTEPVTLNEPEIVRSIENNSVKLTWSQYEGDNFGKYKVYKHQTNSINANTGELIHETSIRAENEFTVELPNNSETYFRVFVSDDSELLGGSNVIKVSIGMEELAASIDMDNSQFTTYYNEIVLDGSRSTGTIESYTWEIVNAPSSSYSGSPANGPAYRYYNDKLPDTSILSFKAREAGEYAIKLTVSDGTEESSTEVRFSVSNDEPDFSFSDIHDESFSNPAEWNVTNYSIEDYIATLPEGTAHGYSPVSSTGGSVSINNNITVNTGTYLYWRTHKDFSNLNINASKDLLFTIKSSAEEYGYELNVTDAIDVVSDFRIVIDGYLISFEGDLDNRDALLFDFFNDYFFRTNLSNQDIKIFFHRNSNGEPFINAICNNQNISERVKISETDLPNSVDFYFYSKLKNIGAGPEIAPRSSNVIKYKISEF